MHGPADILGHLDQMVGQSHGTMIERSADRTYAVHLRGCTSNTGGSWPTGHVLGRQGLAWLIAKGFPLTAKGFGRAGSQRRRGFVGAWFALSNAIEIA